MTISAVNAALAGLEASLAHMDAATARLATNGPTPSRAVELSQAETQVDAAVSVMRETLKLEQELAGQLLDILA